MSLPASATRRFDPSVHHRPSICARDRACLFGEVVAGEMRANAGGITVQAVWEALPERYPGVELDAFAIMPNHLHGIVVLTVPRMDVGAGSPRPGAPALVPRRPRPYREAYQ